MLITAEIIKEGNTGNQALFGQKKPREITWIHGARGIIPRPTRWEPIL